MTKQTKKSEKEKCQICGRVISKEVKRVINGAVTGPYLEIIGHDICLSNVDDLVIIPNRKRAK